jgi:nucleotide-binding universal stress UspA family protein
MNMKILVGYDGSNAAKEALAVARVHARAFQAKVHIVTSLMKGDENHMDDIQSAEQQLDYAVSYMEDGGVSAEKHLLIRGLSPGEDLVNFAEEHDVTEIVIGVKRRSNIGKIIFGSNARYVIMEATCPVVTVK